MSLYEDARNQAILELAQERFRNKVEREKEKMRTTNSRRKWWHSIIPFTITWRNK